MAEIMGTLYQIGDSIAMAFRKFIAFMVIAFIVFVFCYLVIHIIIKYKRHKHITAEQNKILNMGKLNAKKRKLRFLFTSDKGRKIINAGKIVSYVEIEDVDRNKWSIFVVKKGFMEYKFYKVPYEKKYENIFGDVTLNEWNFILDLENRFMVLNEKIVENMVVEKRGLKDIVGVDSLGRLSPVIQKAVQSNPRHRIRLRESKLIKIPDENISTIAEGVSTFLGR